MQQRLTQNLFLSLSMPYEGFSKKIEILRSIENTHYFRRNGITECEIQLDESIQLTVSLCTLPSEGFAIGLTKHQTPATPARAETTGTSQNTPHAQWILFSSDGIYLETTKTPQIALQLAALDAECETHIEHHLLESLAFEYRQAKTGESNTKRLAFLENHMRSSTPKKFTLPHNFHSNFLESAAKIELQSSLKWKERRILLQKQLQLRATLFRTEARIFFFPWWKVAAFECSQNFRMFFLCFSLRPWDNLQGWLQLCTIDVIIWFFNTVRNNIGYSIALAIYGPFTFYFITQPLNPKAMWAVAESRQIYFHIVEAAEQKLKNYRFKFNFDLFAPAKGSPAKTAPSVSHNQLERNLTLENWQERMNNFKGLQIALEKNMVFAARMGRVEQIETQLIFPLTARSAWTETKFYIDAIHCSIQKQEHSHSKQHREFLQNELKRSRRAQFYIWRKLHHFLGDNYFIVMDATNNHSLRNYFLGDSLSLYIMITEELASSLRTECSTSTSPSTSPSLSPSPAATTKPMEFSKNDLLVAKRLQNAFASSNTQRIPGEIIKNISNEVPALADPTKLNDSAYREPMLRQWENLFLLQNRAQEASNFGRMAYTESVRTTLFALQIINTIKHHEIEQKQHPQERELNESLLENAYHLAFADLASIAPEIHHSIPGDTEYEERIQLIADFKDYLQERSHGSSQE